jgi:hypothetical protein
MHSEYLVSDKLHEGVLATRELDCEVSIFKPSLVLAVALFLMIAPDPDAKVISELTSNFIVPAQQVEYMLPE